MKRVLSLLPSTTETLYAIGADDCLVGVTHECDFPPDARLKPQLTSAKINPTMESSEIDRLVREQLEDTGSLYALNMDLVRELRPEIVLSQQLCTVCAVGFETVRGAMATLPEPPEVINIEPKNLDQVLHSFVEIARLVEREDDGLDLMRDLRKRLDAIERAESQRVLFLEWLVPPFSAGHWMAELVEAAGGLPVLANHGSHSRGLEWDAIRKVEFETMVVSCCGFDVSRAMLDIEESPELQELLDERPDMRLVLFDGNHYFSRPGPRLVESAELLAKALRRVPPGNAGASIADPYVLVR